MYVRAAPEPDSVPCAGRPTTANVNVFPSGSTPDRVIPTATSSAVVAEAAVAVGGRFVATTVIGGSFHTREKRMEIYSHRDPMFDDARRLDRVAGCSS